MHTTLQSNDQFNQTNLFLQRLQGISKHSLVITLLFKVSHSCKQCGTNLEWIFRNEVIMVEKKKTRGERWVGLLFILKFTIQYYTAKSFIGRLLTETPTSQISLKRFVILSRGKYFTGTMYCHFTDNHRSANSKHRECVLYNTCHNPLGLGLYIQKMCIAKIKYQPIYSIDFLFLFLNKIRTLIWKKCFRNHIGFDE